MGRLLLRVVVTAMVAAAIGAGAVAGSTPRGAVLAYDDDQAALAEIDQILSTAQAQMEDIAAAFVSTAPEAASENDLNEMRDQATYDINVIRNGASAELKAIRKSSSSSTVFDAVLAALRDLDDTRAAQLDLVNSVTYSDPPTTTTTTDPTTTTTTPTTTTTTTTPTTTTTTPTTTTTTPTTTTTTPTESVTAAVLAMPPNDVGYRSIFDGVDYAETAPERRSRPTIDLTEWPSSLLEVALPPAVVLAVVSPLLLLEATISAVAQGWASIAPPILLLGLSLLLLHRRDRKGEGEG